MGNMFKILLLSAAITGTTPTMAAVAPKTVPGASLSSSVGEEKKDVLVLIEDEKGGKYIIYLSQKEWENLQKEAIKPPKIKKMKKPSSSK